MSDIKIKDYFQLGNHEAQNKFIADEDDGEVEAISLNEFSDETKPGSPTDKIITGIEEFRHGVMSRQTAQFLDLRNSATYSKTASTMNYVQGAEGFISSIVENIAAVIERIVRFIMGGINWLVESGKTLIGLSTNTARREQQARDVAVTRKDMESYLRSVGFPEKLINLENFIDNLAPSYTEAFKNIACDTTNVNTHFQSLSDTLDALGELQKEIAKKNLSVVREQTAIKEAIAKTHSKHASMTGAGVSTHEYQDLVIKMTDGVNNLDFKRFESRVISIMERHYKVAAEDIEKIKNPEYAAGANSVRVALENIQGKLHGARSEELAKAAFNYVTAITSARLNNPPRQIPSLAVNVKFGAQSRDVVMLEIIERSVDSKSEAATRFYMAYVAEVAKYVTLCKEVCQLIQQCIAEQQLFFSFYTRLSAGTMHFLTGGLEAFAAHADEENKSLPDDKKFKASTSRLFKSEAIADDFISQLNLTLETVHKSGDLMNVKSRMEAFRRQMEF